MKVAICIPDNHPTYRKQFIRSLLGMLDLTRRWASKTQKDLQVSLVEGDSGWLDSMRNSIVKTCGDKFRYLLWCDSDMVFPDFTLVRMLSHFEADKKLEAVSG